MEADALENRPQHLRLACLQLNVEEYPGCRRVFKRTAVAMQPRCKDHASRTGCNPRDGIGHVIVQTLINRFLTLGHVGLGQIDIDLIQHQMILDPFKALACRLHFGKIIVFAFFCADNARNHRRKINRLMVHHRSDPAGRAGIDMRTADGGAARTHADKRRVASAAVNPCSGTEAQFLRGLFRQKPRHVGAFNDLRQVPRLDAVHPAKFFVPALTTGPRVIKKRRIGRITRHDEFSRRPCDQGFLHIQPFVGLLEDFRLMRLYPFIFPERILDTRGRSVRRAQRAQQHPDVHAGNTRPVRLTCLEFRQSPLVHIAHRAAQRAAIFIHEHHALHLRTKGNAGHLRRHHVRLFKHSTRGTAHGRPPFICVLLRAAVWQDI